MSNYNYSATPFKYTPSIPAASVFLGLFTLTTVWHLYEIIRFKTWHLTPLIICGILEVVGYASRLASIQYPFNISLYSAQYAFIVLAPILLAASVYIILGKIIRFVNGRSLISGKIIAFIFVGCDIVTFFIQIIGAIILLNKKSSNNANIGKDILLAGLVVQLLTFVFFVVVAIHFDITVAKSGQHGGKWRGLMRALYAASALIMGRSIYRIVEFAGDTTSYLQTTEWPFYIFDAVFIFIAMIIFNIIYPPKYLVEDSIDSDTKSSVGQEIQMNGNAPVITSTTNRQDSFVDLHF